MKRILPICISFLFISQLWNNCHAQSMTSIVQQDPKMEQLLNEKRKINNALTVSDKFKIQIFYGDNENAKKTLSEFKKEFKDIDGTLVFSTPSYKVWVGSFKSKIEALNHFNRIKKKYPNALIIRPN